jgi:FkbM family methyltransferase
MNYSLVMIGAHDGSKTSSFIQECAALGNVLLVEPVPYLYEKLAQRFAGTANIACLNEAISGVDGEVDFYMPAADANEIAPYGDQLGSLIADHAEAHDSRFREKVRKIRCKSRTMYSLLAEFDIRAIDVLWTDMEGYDATCLLSFPFGLVKPRKILFEAKHADGMHRIGRKFATLLLLLEELQYRVKMHDNANCFAIYSP